MIANIISHKKLNPIVTELFIRGRKLNIAIQAKWLSCVLSIYLCGTFDCMLLSYHERISEWIYTL